MIRRLVEAHYFANRAKPRTAQIAFWLKELRSPQLLLEVAQSYPKVVRRLATTRPLLRHAASGSLGQLEDALAREEQNVRKDDRAYWLPLREELERLRHPK
jgi:hypothetical protein